MVEDLDFPFSPYYNSDKHDKFLHYTHIKTKTSYMVHMGSTQ